MAWKMETFPNICDLHTVLRGNIIQFEVDKNLQITTEAIKVINSFSRVLYTNNIA